MTNMVMYTDERIRVCVIGHRPSTSPPAGERGDLVIGTNVKEQSAVELTLLSEDFESAPASKIVGWAVDTYGDSLVVAASFEDIVLIDLAAKIDPQIEVVFLDTEAHFPETLAFVEEVRARYDLNLTVTRPGPEAAAHPCGTAQCCQFRKVEPLRRAVDGRRAWMTSLRRTDGPTRAGAPIVSWDESFGLVKINPLATWTDDDIASYLADNGLPKHPLFGQGYRSIGCAPTTRPVSLDEDPRAGRWSGLDKSECGLHL
jgi:phosphoadenosine phosphosulfate reductase